MKNKKVAQKFERLFYFSSINLQNCGDLRGDFRVVFEQRDVCRERFARAH